MSVNPYVMYLIVRESLAMSPGKLAAQCGHAVMMMMDDYHLHTKPLEGGSEWARGLCNTMREWLTTDYTKIVLRADDAEWDKLKKSLAPHPFVVVEDRGYTEVPANTETVMALWPMRKNERPSILRRLRLL